MKIKWLGHSSFLITSKNDFKILTDPFPSTIGYKVQDIEANIVTISHHHFDHNCLKFVRGDYALIDKPGETLFNKMLFKGFHSYHDDVMGAKRSLNTIFTFDVDNITICHLGDLGYIPSKEEISTLGPINVLFIPVGGNYTIDSTQAAEVCRLINPNIIVPMHYKTPALNFDLDKLDNFLVNMGNFKKVNANYIEILSPKDMFRKNNEVLILNY